MVIYKKKANFNRKLTATIIACFATMMFVSCSYNLDGEKLNAMPEGRAKDSLMFLKDHSVTYGTVLYAVKDTVYLMSEPARKATSTVIATSGDVFMVIGRKSVDFGQRSHYSKEVIPEDAILFEITGKSGKIRQAYLKADEMYGNLAPKIWTEKSTEKWKKIIMTGLAVSLALMIFYFIGFRIYRYICRKRNREAMEPGSISIAVYNGFALLLGILIAVYTFVPELLHRLYYNPDIFSNWSNHNILIRLIPVFLIGMLLSAVATAVEVKIRTKCRGFWYLIPLLGQFAFGVTLVLLTVVLIRLIYIAVIAIVALFVLGGKSGALNQKMGRTVGYTHDGRPIRDDTVLGQNMVQKRQ
ncbi:MAG: hypothetical protein LBR52_05025 [Prevotellaceae bacterium]|jgi:hypothetical protein|nr:hypothetical protein [Prevotellaceae bacterium]